MLRDRPTIVAFTISAALHLSLVTVFTVVVYFPVETTHYYQFDIVNPITRASLLPGASQELKVPSIDDVLASGAPGHDQQPLTIEPGLAMSLTPELPSITLPTFGGSEFERLELRHQSLSIRSAFEETQTATAWERFSREMGQLREAISRFSLFSAQESDPSLQYVGRPVDGVVLYIEWMSGPKDRTLLFSPPIENLWRLDPASLAESIALVFTVSPSGEVIEVLTPLEDDAGVIASAGKALLKYRFEPLPEGQIENQHGTFLIAPEERSQR
jgi:hypothetical protein